jgi:glyoxylate reductase
MREPQVVTRNDAPIIIMAAPVSTDLVAMLIAAGRVVPVEEGRPLDDPQLRGQIADATALLVDNTRSIPAELLAAAPHLKVVSTVSVGIDHIDVVAATARNIAVCNTPGVLDHAVAELTALLILSLSRRAIDNFRAVKSGAWSRGEQLPPFGSDLRKKTLGVLGMGRTGRAVARVASQGLGMRVIYHSRGGPVPGTTTDFPVEYATRPDLFRMADFLSVHVDLNRETAGSVGRNEFDLMKSSAYLINVSRGAVVDEEALIEALRARRIAGAGLDVMQVEPPQQDNALLTLDNVVITPHIGSATVETRHSMAEMAVRNLLAVCSGDVPEAIVNAEAIT